MLAKRQALKAMSARAQETRLRIVRYLVRTGMDGAAAGDIGKAVDASSSRLSFHLTRLEEAGLVSSKRESRSIRYRADFDRLGELIGYLLVDCCGDRPEVRACCGADLRESN